MTTDQLFARAKRMLMAPRKAKHAATQRARLKAANLCITAASHGAPIPGRVRCERCIEVHRRSA